MTTRWWWQNAFSFRPVYIWQLNIAAANRNAEWIQKQSKPVQPIQQVFWRTTGNKSRHRISRPFVSFDIFQLIFVRETRIRSTQHSKRCTHNVYRAVTAANVGRGGGRKNQLIFKSKNVSPGREWPWPRPSAAATTFFPPQLYIRKRDRNFFPTLFSSNFYFSSVRRRDLGGPWQTGNDVAAFQHI